MSDDKQIATNPSQFGAAYSKVGTVGAAMISGAETAPVADVNGRTGWAYVKELADPPTVGKINWFFGVPTTETLPVSHYSCMYAILSIDHYNGTVQGLPWLTMYTKAQGDGSDASWYRSKVDHHIPIQRELIRPGERICIFTGNHHPPAEQLNGARVIHLGQATTGPAVLGTDHIQFFVLQTNTESLQSGFCVEKLCYMTKSDKPDATQYNLHLTA